MNKYLLPLALAAAFGCDNNQSTPDNPFNNLEDALVNFDKDVGVKDAAPMFDVAQIPDTSPLDESIQDQSVPDAASDASNPQGKQFEHLFTLEGTVLPAPLGHLHQAQDGILYSLNHQGDPRAVLFTQERILWDQTYQTPERASLTDIIQVGPTFAFVGAQRGIQNNNLIYGELNAQGQLMRYETQTHDRNHFFSSLAKQNTTLIEAGTLEGQAQLCWRELFVDARECVTLDGDIVNDIGYLPGFGIFAVGNSDEQGAAWFINDQSQVSQTANSPANQLYAVAINDTLGLCVAGKQGEQGYVAMYDAATLELVWEHVFPGLASDVAAAGEDCVVAGDNGENAIIAQYSADEKVWQATLDRPDTLATSILETPTSYIVAVDQGDPLQIAIYTIRR